MPGRFWKHQGSGETLFVVSAVHPKLIQNNTECEKKGRKGGREEGREEGRKGGRGKLVTGLKKMVGLPDKIQNLHLKSLSINNQYFCGISWSQILHMTHTNTEKLFIVYLKFKLNWAACSLFAKPGNL